MGLLHEDLTGAVIGAAFEVHQHLGYGFLEKVYQKALLVELELRQVPAVAEAALSVQYKGRDVGLYLADLLVDDRVLVKIKVSPEYRQADEAQLLNELKGLRKTVGLLVNFGKEKVEFRRFARSLN